MAYGNNGGGPYRNNRPNYGGQSYGARQEQSSYAQQEMKAEKLSGNYAFLASNDLAGGCPTTLPFWFETEAEARAFKAKADAAGCWGTMPIDTGKHVYSNWTPIMQKHGAFHPAFDPFKMEANRDLNMNYSKDMCPKALSYLSRAVYIGVNPDWDEKTLDAIAEKLH